MEGESYVNANAAAMPCCGIYLFCGRLGAMGLGAALQCCRGLGLSFGSSVVENGGVVAALWLQQCRTGGFGAHGAGSVLCLYLHAGRIVAGGARSSVCARGPVAGII